MVIKLFIQTFGNEINGLVATARQMLEYLNILDGGVGVAVVAMLFKPLANKNYIRANQIIIAANRYYKKIGIIFYLILFILAYGYSYLLTHTINNQMIFWIIILTGAMYFSNFFIVPGYNFFIIAEQREYITKTLQILATLIGPIMMFVFMKLNFNVYLVRFVPVLINLLIGISVKYYVSFQYPWINIKGSTTITLKKQAKDMLYHKVASLIMFNTDMIILSITTSFVEVSIYSIYLSIYYLASNILNPLIFSGRTGLGQLLAEGELGKAQKVFSTYEYILYLITFILLTMLSITTVPFIRIYVDGLKGIQFSDNNLNLLFSIMFLMDLLRGPPQGVITVSGHFKQTKYRALTEALLNIIFSIWLVYPFGIYGVLFGSIIAFSYRVIDIIIYSSKRILYIPLKKTVSRIFVNSGIAIILYLVGKNTFPKVENYVEWFLYAGIYFLVITIIFSTINYLVDSTPIIDFLHRIDIRKYKSKNF